MNWLDWTYVVLAAIGASYGLLHMFRPDNAREFVLGFLVFGYAATAIVDQFLLAGKCPTP